MESGWWSRKTPAQKLAWVLWFFVIVGAAVAVGVTVSPVLGGAVAVAGLIISAIGSF